MKLFLVAFCAAMMLAFTCFAEEKPTPAATQQERPDQAQATPSTAPGAMVTQTPGEAVTPTYGPTASQVPGTTAAQAGSSDVEIKQTFEEEIKSDNGTLLCVIAYSRPVFTGNSKASKKIERTYAKEEKAMRKDANQLKKKAEAEYVRAGEAGEKFIGPAYYQVNAAKTYEKHDVISFVSRGSKFEFGAHPGNWIEGDTFDLKTGDRLRIDDVLNVNKNNAADIISREFGLVFGSKLNKNNREYMLEQSGLNAVFALQEDGVHIYYNEDTISHAFGIPDLIIPYTRTDLVKAPFAI
jgi:hypothetical protein